MPHIGNVPSLAQNKIARRVLFWLLTALVGILVVSLVSGFKEFKEREAIKEAKGINQIYPNYEFPEGVNQIKVPLIPRNQMLSRDAGGWVVTPSGSEYRIDYDVPVVIEYNDGRKFVRQPKKPAHDGVRPTNGIFRLYGEGSAEIFIKRNVY